MSKTDAAGITRREFARRAALATAAGLIPADKLPAVPVREMPQQPADAPQLSAASQAEADARYQTIVALYGSRFSDTQKSDVRKLSTAAQATAEKIRAYHTENGDDPALYLKPLVEREKKNVLPPLPTPSTPNFVKRP